MAVGEFEINVMTPLVTVNLADAFELFTRGIALTRAAPAAGIAHESRARRSRAEARQQSTGAGRALRVAARG